jgi:hypothetical protein
MPDLPLRLWYLISSFGGAGVTLPLALAIAVWLAIGYSARMALNWLVLLTVAVVLVTGTKLAFLGWGIGVHVWDFTGLSGHAMLSTAVYPVALFLVLLPAQRTWRIAGVVIGLALGMAVSYSRIVLEAHSPSEAITGCLVGALTALLFIRLHWDATPGRLSAAPVILSLLLLTVALHGVHLPTHRWVTHLALRVSGHERPYVRAHWKNTHVDDDDDEAIVAPLSHSRGRFTASPSPAL